MMTNNNKVTNAHSGLADLLEVMKALRDPDSGCPWDLKQSFQSIVPHTLEEAYEVADAIYRNDMVDIKEELGDLLFQVVFYSQLGQEQGAFHFDEVAAAMAQKLIRRHPHVFSPSVQDTNDSLADDVLNQQWDAIKQQERTQKAVLGNVPTEASILANIPVGLSPLIRASKIQKKCANVGFDWPEIPPVVAKVHEEIDEVLEAHQQPQRSQSHVEEEIGDLLFAVVNLSRHLSVDPERALQLANNKFIKRFQGVEKYITENHGTLDQTSLEEMESAWGKVKQTERKR